MKGRLRKRRRSNVMPEKRAPYLVILDAAAPPMLLTVWLKPGEPLPLGRLATDTDLQKQE